MHDAAVWRNREAAKTFNRNRLWQMCNAMTGDEIVKWTQEWSLRQPAHFGGLQGLCSYACRTLFLYGLQKTVFSHYGQSRWRVYSKLCAKICNAWSSFPDLSRQVTTCEIEQSSQSRFEI